MAKALCDMSVGSLLYTTAQRYPAKIAVVESTGKRRRHHFKELNEKVNMLSHGLMQMGLKKGDFLKRHFTVGFFSLDLIAMCVEHGYWLPS